MITDLFIDKFKFKVRKASFVFFVFKYSVDAGNQREKQSSPIDDCSGRVRL